MSKSSGIAYFCGKQLGHVCNLAGMGGSVNAVVKTYPRAVGVVVRSGNAVTKTVTVDCVCIPPKSASRADLETYMNTFNETVATQQGSLVIDDNEYLDCVISSVNYGFDILNNFVKYTVAFELGIQSTDDTVRYLTPSLLYQLSGVYRGGTFTNKAGSVLKIWHNMDIVRNLENTVVRKIYDGRKKDFKLSVQGGVEKIKAACWLRSPMEDQEPGWKQTVGAYIYNIMEGAVGEIGTLQLGTGTIENCLLQGVSLTEMGVTSARYELDFVASLQC